MQRCQHPILYPHRHQRVTSTVNELKLQLAENLLRGEQRVSSVIPAAGEGGQLQDTHPLVTTTLVRHALPPPTTRLRLERGKETTGSGQCSGDDQEASKVHSQSRQQKETRESTFRLGLEPGDEEEGKQEANSPFLKSLAVTGVAVHAYSRRLGADSTLPAPPSQPARPFTFHGGELPPSLSLFMYRPENCRMISSILHLHVHVASSSIRALSFDPSQQAPLCPPERPPRQGKALVAV